MSHHCSACPFKQNRCVAPRKVFGKGGLAIIGEAPGTTEVVQNQLFVGPDGVALRKTLASAGLMDLSKVFMTTSLLCLPPNGEADSEATVTACKGRLFSELERRKPDIILALGNTALHAITGNFKLKITQEQGKLFNTKYGLMIPAVHPAMVIKAPNSYKGFRSALAYTIKLANGHKPKNPGVSRWSVISVDKIPKAYESLQKLEKGHVLSVDIETTGFNPRKNRIITLGISWDTNKTLIFEGKHVTLLKNLLEDKHFTFVWHNGKFDSEFLYNVGINARVDEDTMLLHYALNEVKGTHDLEYLAINELGAEAYEHKLKSYLVKKKGQPEKTYADIPRPILDAYLAKDCDYTRQLYMLFKGQVNASKDLKNMYDKVLIPASPFLQRVERRGISIDRPNIDKLHKELTAESGRLRNKLLALVDDKWDPMQYVIESGAKSVPAEFNPGSPAQLKWLLYDKLNLKPGKGLPRNTRESTLESIRPQNPIIESILELRGIEKQLSTYVNGVLNKIETDGRVHCSFLIHGTVTGRLSSQKPNMQNIPRDPAIRSIFRSAPGHILLEADYKGAELRMLAYLSQDPSLIQVFQEGRDLHTEVAIEMYGPQYTSNQRVRAKAINFGIPYGRGPKDIAREFGISVKEAADLIQVWFARFPKAAAYLEMVRGAVSRGKILRTPLGRLRRFGLISTQFLHDMENQAANFAISSTASDMTLISGARLQPLLHMIDCHIVNIVHDSLLVEVPEKEGAILQASKLLIATMANTPHQLLQSKVPFEIELKRGTHWGLLEEFEIIELTQEMKTALLSKYELA